MSIDVKNRTQIINELNFKIDQIIKLEDVRLQPYFKDQLITPFWDFSKKSIRSTITHYESILNKIINIQLIDVDFNESHTVKRDTTINYIADILIILSLTIEFYDNDDVDSNV
ncbi:hypothetical protein CXF85_00875 [Colwellia sp. 75C3]|uniref:hypothetical protein n=1 Tax=Colwellia sp. 75C3 TaxID=888425 RepID=UPI000C320447|nr:hypothetical protein [Colwellia sp. 75C3]PKG86295.1 hypothetical protein CXF85_00875 [Colwellia sp. 75C3]